MSGRVLPKRAREIVQPDPAVHPDPRREVDEHFLGPPGLPAVVQEDDARAEEKRCDWGNHDGTYHVTATTMRPKARRKAPETR